MSASLIDNIFVNNPDQVLISGNIITDVSDHFSQFCIMTSGRKEVANKTTKKHDFSDFSSVQLTNDLSIVDWDNIIVLKANSVDDQFSSFYRQLNKFMQKHAPLKVVSKCKIKQLEKP